ncbi:Snaclec A11 [Elysia marginata]|uniref:Snaclec A11 n=1 Tax=Elysia marginata TaxID=1093978 RepID=A0AAV4JHK7_9GAST|nr:Snaclec A11 [Elysia marginata]
MFSYSDFCFDLILNNSMRRNWWDARAFCRLNGGDLVSYDKKYPKKEHFIFGLVGEHFHRFTRPNRFWLGLKESGRDNLFRWLDGFVVV